MTAKRDRVATRDDLEDFLASLNDRGTVPTAAVVPDGKYGEPILVYGLDLGDQLGFAWFADPGEEAKWCEASDAHLVYPRLSWNDLPEGPYTVLYQDGVEETAAPAAEVGGGASPASSPGVLTPAIAAAVLWKFGQPGGLEPGHFIKALLEAISVADLSNRAKLRQAFPGHVEAWGIGANERDGVERLQSIAAGLSDVDGRVVPDPDPAVDSGVGGAAGYRAPGTTLGSCA